MVMEEYKETNERYDFLVRESEDLEKAIVSLKEIIKEMDQKINVVFASTFEEINKEFSKYFRIIFGGGNARLIKAKVRTQKKKNKDSMEEIDQEDLDVSEESEQDKNENGIDS